MGKVYLNDIIPSNKDSNTTKSLSHNIICNLTNKTNIIKVLNVWGYDNLI